jgi:hypothetical protein
MDLIDIINKNFHYIGEILVVVFGVLIAFFISNGNEERKRRKRIKQILEIVKLNFKEDIKNIKVELEKLASKEKNVINLVDSSIDNKSLSYEIKFSALNFLFNHPSIVLQKEGYYLLKDADFNYDTKRNKIVSEIITTYSYHFENIERQRDRVIKTSEHNSINHMQDPWQHYNADKEDRKKKIDDYLDSIINSENFINEIDYMANIGFGAYRRALEDYLKAVNLILEKLKQ